MIEYYATFTSFQEHSHLFSDNDSIKEVNPLSVSIEYSLEYYISLYI